MDLYSGAKWITFNPAPKTYSPGQSDLLVSADCVAVLTDALRPRQGSALRVVPVSLRPCE